MTVESFDPIWKKYMSVESCCFNKKKTPNLMTWNSSKHLLSPTFCGLAEKFWLSVSPGVTVRCESTLPSLEGLAEAGSASGLSRGQQVCSAVGGGFSPSVWGLSQNCLNVLTAWWPGFPWSKQSRKPRQKRQHLLWQNPQFHHFGHTL